MLERLKGRKGPICFCVVIWAVLTLAHFLDVEIVSSITSRFQVSHFLKAPQTLKRRPGPGADQVGEKTSSNEEEERKEKKRKVEEEEKEEEKLKEQEVDELIAEAGRYDAWWREQIARRVRVAETCVREGINNKAERNTFLYDPEHRLLFCRNAKVKENLFPRYSSWLPSKLKEQFGDSSFTSFAKMILKEGEKRTYSLLSKIYSVNNLRCAYCTTYYTVIAKAETFTEDLRYISHLANVTFEQEVKRNHNNRAPDTAMLAKKYFSQLEKGLAEELYQLYRVDFEMFGYSPQPYLDLAER